MTIFDLILLIILGGFTMFGLWFGFIHTLGAIIGTFAGAFFAGLWYDNVAYVMEALFGHPNLMKILSFIVIFILINRIVGFGFYVLDKIFDFLNFVPFLRSINRLLGGILGFFEGVLVVGLSLFVMIRFPLVSWLNVAIDNSLVAPWFIRISGILQFVLPELLKKAQAMI